MFTADKGHLHHRLMAQGFTQKQSVAILYAASATLGMLAIILIDDGIYKALSFLLVLIAIVAIGFKELKKYKDYLLKENVRLGLVEGKNIENKQESKLNKIQDADKVNATSKEEIVEREKSKSEE